MTDEIPPAEGEEPRIAYATDLGEMWHGDSLEALRGMDAASVNLIMTSPPFPLIRKKAYGNRAEGEYVDWFMQFAAEFKRVITEDGSIVIDLGGAWMPGQATKSLYQHRLLIRMVDDLGLYLAEDFYWFSRSRLPGPVQWVNIERVRVKDSVNQIFWLSKSPTPKASNLNVLKPYSRKMKALLRNQSYNAGTRDSGHVIGDKSFLQDHGGAIPPNVIEVEIEEEVGGPLSSLNEPDNLLDYGNTHSTGHYRAFLRENDLKGHPARFPSEVPEFFIKFLTEKGDLVLDPFAGSNCTGAVAEDLKRRWMSVEMHRPYILGSLGRFSPDALTVHDETLKPYVDPI